MKTTVEERAIKLTNTWCSIGFAGRAQDAITDSIREAVAEAVANALYASRQARQRN